MAERKPKSQLEAVLKQDQHMQGTGNTSLAFKSVSRKELKKKQQSANGPQIGPQAPGESAPASADTPTAPTTEIKFALLINLTRYVNNEPQPVGALGLALIHSVQAQTVSLVCYDPQTQKQHIVIPITANFQYIVQPNYFLSFWDLEANLYACQTASQEALEALLVHINIVKFKHLQKLRSSSDAPAPLTFNLAPSENLTPVKAGDLVRIKYSIHLLSTAQQCLSTDIDFMNILGQPVDSSDGKSILLGSPKDSKELQAFHVGLEGACKTIPRIIIAPATLCYDAKESVKIPPHSDLVIVATIEKVKVNAAAQQANQGQEQQPPQQQSTPQSPQQHQEEEEEPRASLTTSASGVPADNNDEESQRKERLKQRMARLSTSQQASRSGQKQVAGTPLLNASTGGSLQHSTTSVDYIYEGDEAHAHDNDDMQQYQAPVQVIPIATQHSQQQQQQPVLMQAPSTLELNAPAPRQQQPNQQFQQSNMLNTSQNYQQQPQQQQQQPQPQYMSPSPQHQMYGGMTPLMQPAASHNQLSNHNNFSSPHINNNNAYHLQTTPSHYNPNPSYMTSPQHQQQQQNQYPYNSTPNMPYYNTNSPANTNGAQFDHLSNRIEQLYVLLTTTQTLPVVNADGEEVDDNGDKLVNIALNGTHLVSLFRNLTTQAQKHKAQIEDYQAQIAALKKQAAKGKGSKLALDSDGEDQGQVEQLQETIIALQRAAKQQKKEFNELKIKYNTLEMSMDGDDDDDDDDDKANKQQPVEESEQYIALLDKLNKREKKVQQLISEKESLSTQLQEVESVKASTHVLVETAASGAEISELKDRIAASTSQLAQLTTQITEKDAQIEELTAQFAELQAANDTLTTSTADLEATIAQLTGQLEAHAKTPEAVQTDAPPAANESQQRDEVVIDVESDPKFIEMKAQVDELTSLQSSHIKDQKIKSEQIQQQLEQITILEGEKSQLQSQVSTLTAECSALGAKVADSEARNADMTVQMTQLSNQRDELQVSFDAYKDRFKYDDALLEERCDGKVEETLLLAKERQQKIIEQAKVKMGDLQEQIAAYETALAEKDAENEANVQSVTEQAKARMDKLKAIAVDLKAEKDQLSDDNDALEQQLNQFAAEKEALEQQLNELLVEKQTWEAEQSAQSGTKDEVATALSEQTAKLLQVEAELSTTRASLREAQNRVENMASEVNIIKDDRDKTQQQLQNSLTALQTQLDQVDSAPKYDAELETKCQELAQKCERLEVIIASSTDEKDALFDQKSALFDENQRLLNSIEELQQIINNAKVEEDESVVAPILLLTEATQEYVASEGQDEEGQQEPTSPTDSPTEAASPQADVETPPQTQTDQSAEIETPAEAVVEETIQPEVESAVDDERPQQVKPEVPVEDDSKAEPEQVQDGEPVVDEPQTEEFVVEEQKQPDPVPSSSPAVPKSINLFGDDDNDDDDDDDLLLGSSTLPKTVTTPVVKDDTKSNTQTPTSPPASKVPSLFKTSNSLFDDDDEDELFTSPTIKLQTKAGNLFDDDLF